MDVVLKMNNETNGRDKLARLFQYTSRIVWHQLEQRDANKYSIDRMRNLENTLGLFRKILRFGRCIDVCYTALSSLHIEDPWLRHTITISRITRSLFLFADHIVWLSRIGFLKADSNSWNRTANRFWLLSIIANIIRDFYELSHILELNNVFLHSRASSMTPKSFDASGSLKYLFTIFRCHRDVCVDTLKNSCDLLIPLTTLGYTKLSPSTVGVLGAVSSLAALLTIVKPITKLVPSS